MSDVMTQNGNRTLSIRPFGSVDVDLWDHKFETVPQTRSVQRRSRELGDEIATATDDDKAIELLAEMIDLRVKPKGQGRKKASQFIVEKWQADEVTVPQLEQFLDELLEADRPT